MSIHASTGRITGDHLPGSSAWRLTEPGGWSLPELIFGPTRRTNDKSARTYSDIRARTRTRIRLLADCHTAFGTEQAIPTMRLLQQLRADPEAPWADYGPRGEGLTAMRLGKLLADYDIRPAPMRFVGLGQTRGYRRNAFTDAWRRYTPDLITNRDDTAESFPGSSL